MVTVSAPAQRASGTTPPELLRARTVRDGARPLLTSYDGVTDERAELSATTLDNWVAKTANLLQDELGLGSGATVRLHLPAHWQAAVWVLACWSVGAVVADPGVGGPADLVVAGPDALPAALGSGAADVVALSLRPLGAGWPSPLPAGVLDYAEAIPVQGDRFLPYATISPDLPALTVGRSVYTQGGLVDLARGCVEDLGLRTGERLLTDARPATLRGALEVVLVPLLVGGSVVLVRHAPEAGTDPAADARRAAAERVTRDLRPAALRR